MLQRSRRASSVLLFAVASLAGAAQADTFLDRFVPALELRPEASCKTPGCGCADMGGEWTGACSVNGKETAAPTKLSIQQKSCQGIVIEGETLPIGGQRTTTLTTAPALCEGAACALPPGRATTGSTETTVDWDRDKTTLVMHQDGRRRVLSGISETSTIDGTLRRDGAHLLLDVTAKSSAGTPSTVSCSFEK